MKTPISSYAWEKRKALIADLYLKEGWPLKQVMKQVRSDGFSPSETQLRSRLKKWRITRRSRQTHKEPWGINPGDDFKGDEKSVSSVSSRSHNSPASNPGVWMRDGDGIVHKSTIRPDTWERQIEPDKVSRFAERNKTSSNTVVVCSPDGTLSNQNIFRPGWPIYPACASSDMRFLDQKWSTALAQHLTTLASAEHSLISGQGHLFPDHNSSIISSDQSDRPSPVPENVLVDTSSAVTSTHAASPLYTEPCFISPKFSTPLKLAQWWPRSVSADMSLRPVLHPSHWHHTSFEAVTSPFGIPYPLNPVQQGLVTEANFQPAHLYDYNEGPKYYGCDATTQMERDSVPSYDHPPTMNFSSASQPAGPQAAMFSHLMLYMS